MAQALHLAIPACPQGSGCVGWDTSMNGGHRRSQLISIPQHRGQKPGHHLLWHSCDHSVASAFMTHCWHMSMSSRPCSSDAKLRSGSRLLRCRAVCNCRCLPGFPWGRTHTEANPAFQAPGTWMGTGKGLGVLCLLLPISRVFLTSMQVTVTSQGP